MLRGGSEPGPWRCRRPRTRYRAQPRLRLVVHVSEPHGEAHARSGLEHDAVNAEIPTGECHVDLAHMGALWRHGEAAVDITAGRADAADASLLLAPLTDEVTFEVAIDALTLPTAVTRPGIQSASEPLPSHRVAPA